MLGTKETFENCLVSDQEYQKEYARLEELRAKLKKLDVGFSFGVYGQHKDKQIVDQAVEKTRQGEKTEPVSIKTARERTQDEIFLTQKAISKQEALLKKMEPEIMRKAAKKYEPEAKELYANLANSAAEFLDSLTTIREFQFRLRHEVGIDEKILPWRIDETVFNDFGVISNYGGGRLQLLVEALNKTIGEKNES